MPNTSVTIEWLFAAIFADGSLITQTPEDVSEFDSTRSAYYDVIKAQDEGRKLVSFGLFNDMHVWSVSLIDGHFEFDGHVFSAQPVESPVIPIGGEFELVFFRDHAHDVILYNDGRMEAGAHRMGYRFGWKYRVKDKTWEQTIVIT